MRVEHQPDGSSPNPYEDASPPEFFSASNDSASYDLPDIGILADGSANYGNGIYGPSLADQIDVNQYTDRLSTHHRKLPALPIVTIAGLTAAACTPTDAGGKTAPTPIVEPVKMPERFLRIPATSSNMRIQQGWIYTDGTLHKGIDYITGQLDAPDTWSRFGVVAVGEGEACVNPPNREGTAVYIDHGDHSGEHYASYYGHLSQAVEEIPDCNSGKKAKVTQGQTIGISGDSGAPGRIHLHFQVNVFTAAGEVPIDPYDIYSTRDEYPAIDLSRKNGKLCGEKTLFFGPGCPTPQDIKITPTPTTRPESTATRPLPTATLRPESTVARPTITPVKKEVELTPEQQAKTAALQAWFATLEKPQIQEFSAPERKKELYLMPDDLTPWKALIPSIAISNTHPVLDPLKIQWTARSYSTGSDSDKRRFWLGSRYVGVERIKTIRISMNSDRTTNADRANGIGFTSGGAIILTQAYIAVDETLSGGTNDKEWFDRWYDSHMGVPTDFTSYTDDMIPFTVQQKNGVWTTAIAKISGSDGYGPAMLDGFTAPFKALRYPGQTGGGPCQQTNRQGCLMRYVRPNS